MKTSSPLQSFSTGNILPENENQSLRFQAENRKRKPWLQVWAIGSIIMSAFACSDEVEHFNPDFYTPEEYRILSSLLDLPITSYNYVPDESDLSGSRHPEQNALATLGRVLYYDVNLSIDNTVSCGSCHRQSLAFSDNVDYSRGIYGRLTTRNSPALGAFSNFSAYSHGATTKLFWDRRADNLQDQMTQTLKNPNEMGMELDYMVEKLNKLDYYQILSQKAYGKETLDPEMALGAIEHFLNSLVSDKTRYDVAFQKNHLVDFYGEWYGLTADENKGKNIFMKNCASCHQLNSGSGETTMISSGDPVVFQANNGLDKVYVDQGVGDINGSAEFIGVFKVPGLRNIELTAPYMHDGRFENLEEVVDFYSEGVESHPNLHPHLKSPDQTPKRLNLTNSEKTSLILFMKTLTDENLTHNPKWSDPFL